LIKKIFDATINYMQIMDENGNIDQQLFPKNLSDEQIIEMYKYMSLARAVDAKNLSLQRQGRAVTYAPLLGEEATQVGSAYAMRENDLFVPAFRQHALYMVKGLPLYKLFLVLKGYEDGFDAVDKPSKLNVLPEIVPVATQLPHAAGLAYAKKYSKDGSAVITYVGDGGTSEGDFYEAINFAGVFKLPLIIIIENNGWAISIPRKKQTAAGTLAQKAIAAGIPSIQVDGNDVIGVYKAVSDAVMNSKNGPTVIECITYRMGIHTTADDPTKYRPDADVEAWKPKDPILRLRKYLEAKGLWNQSKEQQMADQNSKLIDAAVDKAEAFVVNPKSMFENIYSYMPDVLKEEEDEAEASGFWQEGSVE
jgi:pyruvate dehydrogenase E1 component alpha subunit